MLENYLHTCGCHYTEAEEENHGHCVFCGKELSGGDYDECLLSNGKYIKVCRNCQDTIPDEETTWEEMQNDD